MTATNQEVCAPRGRHYVCGCDGLRYCSAAHFVSQVCVSKHVGFWFSAAVRHVVRTDTRDANLTPCAWDDAAVWLGVAAAKRDELSSCGGALWLQLRVCGIVPLFPHVLWHPPASTVATNYTLCTWECATGGNVTAPAKRDELGFYGGAWCECLCGFRCS